MSIVVMKEPRVIWDSQRAMYDHKIFPDVALSGTANIQVCATYTSIKTPTYKSSEIN